MKLLYGTSIQQKKRILASALVTIHHLPCMFTRLSITSRHSYLSPADLLTISHHVTVLVNGHPCALRQVLSCNMIMADTILWVSFLVLAEMTSSHQVGSSELFWHLLLFSDRLWSFLFGLAFPTYHEKGYHFRDKELEATICHDNWWFMPSKLHSLHKNSAAAPLTAFRIKPLCLGRKT